MRSVAAADARRPSSARSRARASHETLEPNRHALHQRDVQRRRGGSGALGSPRARHVFDLRDRPPPCASRRVVRATPHGENPTRVCVTKSLPPRVVVCSRHTNDATTISPSGKPSTASPQRGGGGNLRLDLRRGVARRRRVARGVAGDPAARRSAVRRAHGTARPSRPRDPGAATAGHDRLDLPPVLAHDLDGGREPQVQQARSLCSPSTSTAPGRRRCPPRETPRAPTRAPPRSSAGPR